VLGPTRTPAPPVVKKTPEAGLTPTKCEEACVNVANGKRELSLDEALEAHPLTHGKKTPKEHREVFAEAVDFSAAFR